MSEMVGFNGPIFMTHPTKAICPILLVSYIDTYEISGQTEKKEEMMNLRGN